MSSVTVALYVVAFGLWFWLVRRDGGIGIGFRFLYTMNLSLFFLVGPLLGEVFGTDDMRFASDTFQPAVRLSLYAFLSFLTGSYLVYPALIGRSRLIPARLGEKLADPDRLDAQWIVAWVLIGIGFASLPLYGTLRFIPTFGAVYSKLPQLIDTGLVMLCLYAVYGRRPRVLGIVAAVLLGKGVLFTAMSGHAGWVFLNGMFLACLTFLSARFRIARVVALALAGVIAFLPAQMWLNGRDKLRTAIAQGSGLDERMRVAVNIFLNPEPPAAKDQDLVSAYRGRGDYSDLLAAAIDHTPAVEPYAMGETLLETFVAIVPRFLWPDKPFKAGGNEFVSRYTGKSFDENTSVGVHYLFELYINFGVPGVVTGMFLFGLLLAWMEAAYYQMALKHLFVEYCLIMCGWSVCMYSDRVALTLMTIIPSIVLCVSIHIALASLLPSRFLPLMRTPFQSGATEVRRPHVKRTEPLRTRKTN